MVAATAGIVIVMCVFTWLIYGVAQEIASMAETMRQMQATLHEISVTQVRMVDKYITQALNTVGFSLVEVMTPCPIAFGRRNRMGAGLSLMRWMKDNTMSQAKAAKLSDEELEGKIVTGVLVDRTKPEYTAEYQKLIERVQAAEKAKVGA